MEEGREKERDCTTFAFSPSLGSEGCFPADGSRGKNNRIFLPFARILLPLEVVRSSRDSQFLVRFVSFI